MWDGDNWSGRKDNTNRMDIFQNKEVRHILRISVQQVKDEEITNNEIKRWFNKMLKAEDMWRNRQLLFLGRIARMNPEKHPRIFLTLTCIAKRSRGRPFRNIRDLFFDGIKLLISDSDERGDVSG